MVEFTSPQPGAANSFNPLSGSPAAEPRAPRAEGPPAAAPTLTAKLRLAGEMAVKMYRLDGLASDEKQAEAVVRILKAAVDPASWQGGGAVAEYFPHGESLIVRQTADGHKQVGEVLDLLRSAAKSKGRTTPPDEGNPRPGM